MRWGAKGGPIATARPPRPRARHRRRPALPGTGRHARDRREPAPRVRHPARRAGRVRAALAPARRRRPGGRALRRRDRRRSTVTAQRRGAAARSIATSTRAPTRRSRVARRLRPDARAQDPEATVTAGNASGQNDGAAACIVTTPRTAERARPAAARPAGQLGRRRRARRDHGHRPGARRRRRRSPRRPDAGRTST